MAKDMNGKHRKLALIAPYWGLNYVKETNRLVQAFHGETVTVKGLSESAASTYKKLIRHTGLSLKNETGRRPFDFQVELRQNLPAPILLRKDALKFYLKPLRKHTDNVQIWVHKRVWLPSRRPPVSIVFHEREQANVPEWLTYLTIQYFSRQVLKPLDSLTFSEYRAMVDDHLQPLNEPFADVQRSESSDPLADWPETPPFRSLPAHRPAQRLLHNNDRPFEPNRIDPFRQQQTERSKRTIRPFKNP
ncbi:MAG TPA: hypothetical protein VFK44_00080 [Bacillales bacterium]|nr:hypothetical protein [Bacillales bacterium]